MGAVPPSQGGVFCCHFGSVNWNLGILVLFCLCWCACVWPFLCVCHKTGVTWMLLSSKLARGAAGQHRSGAAAVPGARCGNEWGCAGEVPQENIFIYSYNILHVSKQGSYKLLSGGVCSRLQGMEQKPTICMENTHFYHKPWIISSVQNTYQHQICML